MKRKFIAVVVALALLAGAVGVGVHLLNREARADWVQEVKITVNWDEGGVNPYNIQAVAQLLDGSDTILESRNLIPNEGLIAFSNSFTNFSTTAVRVRFTYNPENFDWQGAEPPISRDIQWPNLPNIVVDLLPFE